MSSPWSKELPLHGPVPSAEPRPLNEPNLSSASLSGSSATPTRAAQHSATQWRLPLLLFILTILTTLMAGAMLKGIGPFSSPLALLEGLPFSVTLLSILLVHELGHYLTARHYNIHASLPYFIPAPPVPFIIGTFGAFIRMKSPIRERRALLEVGAAGPIAGFVIAVIAVVIGLQWSTVTAKGSVIGMSLGEPLMFTLISHWLIQIPAESDILLHPVAFAGWIGLFITSLNLLPIGQLDGGHIGYAVFGVRQRYISLAMVGVLIGLGLLGWKGWLFWAALTALIGVGHPPVMDDHVPLRRRQRWIAVISFIIFCLTFIPTPISITT